MSTDQVPGPDAGRRLAPGDVHNVRFHRATMVHPGYVDDEVDRFLAGVAQEMAALHAEKAELRDQVHALQAQVSGVLTPPPPSEQAVRLLASAQQTADNYVAEAEEFSRQMTHDARAQAEEQLRRARENAGAIIQAAQEAATRLVGSPPAQSPAGERTTHELEEQVAYLKAFARATRTQLRSYLEALLSDVETEWGKADPAGVPQPPLRTSAQRGDGNLAPAPRNVAAEVSATDGS
ncbi:DivIVA domain-containing protein [Trujillonella endophytica]|uniref:Cell wall synthesis protein Wag31 n=1 Tax=Trujillonella endophytica TaxID=673521 RepID=A0A1H8SF17_9ACTN|nr:DivIVA domain-containing protein [Trujillella endophytica]SEO77106.1 DivIVA domain-containing protein [Trujillella endophytica]